LYSFKVKKAQESDDGNSIAVDLEVTSEGKQEGRTHRTYFNLTPKSLWVLARFLDAIGIDIPDDAADMDLDEWIDKELVAEIAVQRYNNEDKLRIDARSINAIDEAEEPEALSSKRVGRAKEEVEDDEPAPRSRRSRDPEPEPEPEDEVEEEPAPRRGRGRPPGSKNKSRADREEEDEKPSRKSKNKLPQLSAAEIEDMSEEELDDLVEKYDLEVDLSKDRTLGKKAARVCDELDSKGLLTDE
jgi:hypothetical protein